MNIDIMELPKNAEIWQILAQKLAYVKKKLYLCSVKGKTTNKYFENMTATLTFNPRNRLAMSTMEYIQSLGVFTITTHRPEKARRRTKVNQGVDQQLWSDLKGALREVKSHHEGKQQMQDAYELLNEL